MVPVRCASRTAALCLALLVLLSHLSHGIAGAQAPYIPYFGKNAIRYDRFDWHIYQTDHFEIYYYSEIAPHLERIAGYAESAYQHVSAELRHDLAFKVPLILFSTSAEFWQQNVIPGAAQEGVGAFAEPSRNRIVMPIDEPSDLLYRLITHELTHVFQFDIIPAGLGTSLPLWTMEGMADYLTGHWRPLDLMTVRDAAVSDIVPAMSEMRDYGGFSNPRLIYNLGHAAFEFMEARWGKEGVRQYIFALRRSIIGGGSDAFKEAFTLSADDWDQQFDRYLDDRFKPFRDKERPADYGRNLAPDPRKSRFATVLSIEPSPSGDLIAAMTANRRDREIDIVLISTRDGEIIRNLTHGFDQGLGFEYLATPGGRWNSVPWMSWDPTGDRLAYFARTEKDRSLIVQNVVTRKIELRVPLEDIDAPESPDFSPDGRLIAFSGMQAGQAHLHVLDVATRSVRRLTTDALPHYAPSWSPDGRSLVFLARVSGNDKLFRIQADGSGTEQLTFGTHDEGGAQFRDDRTLVFPSTAINPTVAMEPEIARDGQIFNLWTLDLETRELRQYSDALTGNLSPVVVRDGATSRVAFVSYFKGDYGLHVLDRRDELATVPSEDFGAPGPLVDFQAPLPHTLVQDNAKKKGRFEKMFLEGRPPVALGVTSSGDLFGGTQVTLTDVLGDRQFNLLASSVSQYRSLAGSWLNLDQRLTWGVQGYANTQFFFGQTAGVFFDPAFSGLIDRDFATATRTVRGAGAFAVYPFNRYRRLELFGGINHYREEFVDQTLESFSQDFQQQQFGRTLFNNGTLVPLGAAFVQETTVFREFGPLSGSTMRLAYEVAPKIGNTLSRQTFDADVRKYLRIGSTGVFAMRARGFTSTGDSPDFFYFGGNSELRGYDYLSFVGQHGFFLNTELRFPLIEAMATPIGILGGVRAAFFAGVGGAWWDGRPFKVWERNATVVRPVIGFDQNFEQALGDAVPVSGFRLEDSRASYGISLMTSALGYPVHLDWSWRTLFNRSWEDVVFAQNGGSAAFRKPKFAVWIGYDF
ncbi:MAG: hypothetical protein AB7Q16_05410 [Vicinamibacterales bacterium]